MRQQLSDKPDSCWISSLATVTDIDVDLFMGPHEGVEPPAVFGEAKMTASVYPHVYRHSLDHIEHVLEWQELMESLGYRMDLHEQRPAGKRSIALIVIWMAPWRGEGHAFAVDEDGTIWDSLTDSPLTGENVDNLGNWCNISVVSFVTVQEAP